MEQFNLARMLPQRKGMRTTKNSNRLAAGTSFRVSLVPIGIGGSSVSNVFPTADSFPFTLEFSAFGLHFRILIVHNRQEEAQVGLMNLHFQVRYPVALPRGSVQLGFLRRLRATRTLNR